MTASAIRSAYSYLKTRTDPKLHKCSWRCFFWSMLYPGIPRLAVAAIYVCAAYFLLNRQFETAIILVMIRVTARMVHDVWQSAGSTMGVDQEADSRGTPAAPARAGGTRVEALPRHQGGPG